MATVCFLAPRDNHESTAQAVGTFGRAFIDFGHFSNDEAGWLECAKKHGEHKIGDVLFVDVTDHSKELVEKPPMLSFMEQYPFAPCAIVYVMFEAPDGSKVISFYHRPQRTFIRLHRFTDDPDWKTIFEKLIDLFGEMEPASTLRQLLQKASTAR
ncbi:MAG: hypothetical protein HZA80_00240 [Candidatus Taylorbacteria bacterium]|nr:hypothetical protein [Candidatus Taylorbacteria bacterium]